VGVCVDECKWTPLARNLNKEIEMKKEVRKTSTSQGGWGDPNDLSPFKPKPLKK